MTKTIFQDDEIIIEETPQMERSLVRIDTGTEVLVPTPLEMCAQKPSDDTNSSNIAIGEYQNNFRELLLSTVGTSLATGGHILQTIGNDGTFYRLVSKTELYPAGEGEFWGVGRDAKGHIDGHGRFSKVGGTAAAVASQVFAQGMLIQISFQLAELQAAIQDIKEDRFKDKIRDLNGAVRSIGNDFLTFTNTGSKGGLYSSLSRATQYFSVLCDVVKEEISGTVSNPKFWSCHDWLFWKNTQKDAARRCSLIRSGLDSLWNSIRSMALGYSILDQETGKKVAFDCIKDIDSLDLSKFQEDLRALPYKEWGGFEDQLQKMQKCLKTILHDKEKKPVFILSGHEIHSLMEEANGQ